MYLLRLLLSLSNDGCLGLFLDVWGSGPFGVFMLAGFLELRVRFGHFLISPGPLLSSPNIDKNM